MSDEKPKTINLSDCTFEPIWGVSFWPRRDTPVIKSVSSGEAVYAIELPKTEQEINEEHGQMRLPLED